MAELTESLTDEDQQRRAAALADQGRADAPLTVYERLLVETVDDAELMAWWHMTRSAHQWTAYLSADLGVRLFDAGIRSVREVAEAGETMRRIIGDGGGFDPPFWRRVADTAQEWEPWPRPYREALALQMGLRIGPRPEVNNGGQ